MQEKEEKLQKLVKGCRQRTALRGDQEEFVIGDMFRKMLEATERKCGFCSKEMTWNEISVDRLRGANMARPYVCRHGGRNFQLVHMDCNMDPANILPPLQWYYEYLKHDWEDRIRTLTTAMANFPAKEQKKPSPLERQVRTLHQTLQSIAQEYGLSTTHKQCAVCQESRDFAHFKCQREIVEGDLSYANEYQSTCTMCSIGQEIVVCSRCKVPLDVVKLAQCRLSLDQKIKYGVSKRYAHRDTNGNWVHSTCDPDPSSLQAWRGIQQLLADIIILREEWLQLWQSASGPAKEATGELQCLFVISLAHFDHAMLRWGRRRR